MVLLCQIGLSLTNYYYTYSKGRWILVVSTNSIHFVATQVLDCMEQQSHLASSTSAVFLVRNLAFSSKSKSLFHCNERTIPLLLKCLMSTSLEARAYSASAIWAITFNEHKIASHLRKVGGLPIIQNAQESTKRELKKIDELIQAAGDEGGSGVVHKEGILGIHVSMQSLLKQTEQVHAFYVIVHS
jgi:hypothetical protein